MTKTLAVAGKGGSGKTTFSALLIRYLLKAKKKPILAVDADPNSNLNEALGIEINQTIGELREEITQKVEEIPVGVSKDTLIELKLQQAVSEGDGFDLLVMGRSEGPGCYCYINNILRKYLDLVAENYLYIVIDNEAGMEHLSRRITRDIDSLFLISDPTPRGIEAVARIKKLAISLNLKIGEMFLVINKADKIEESVWERIKKENLNFLGAIPFDQKIWQFDLEVRSLIELPDESLAVREFNRLVEKVII